MKFFMLVMLGGTVLLSATDSSPHSSDAKEGKSVYVKAAKPINLYEESALQKADHNISGHGGAQCSSKPSH